MRGFNKAIIAGNATRDPELRSTPSGQSVTSFSVATNRRFKSASGETQDAVEFHNVVAWGKLAELCQQLIKKGAPVLIEGRLQTRSWEGQDGAKRQTTEIVAENMTLLSSRGNGAEDGGSAREETTMPEEAPAAKTEEEKSKKDKKNDDEIIDIDDIDF
jgi:single-strand DNA-binding protein